MLYKPGWRYILLTCSLLTVATEKIQYKLLHKTILVQ